MALAREPDTGFQIIHVIPDAWGPFVDIRAMYQSLARRNPWTSVITPDQYDAMMPLADARTFFVHWQPEKAALANARNPGHEALVAAVYSEAYDDDRSKMLPEHRAHWDQFFIERGMFDCVFAHTPWMAARCGDLFTPGFVLPVGWDAEAMGAPRWDSHKHTKIGFHGSRVGRRALEGDRCVAWLKLVFRYASFADFTGEFGRALLGRLDQAAISLYVAHSNVRSFSTWRLWQCASTSCVLAADTTSTDVWPFAVEDLIFASLDSDDTCRQLVAFSKDDRLLQSIAHSAHEVARKYTVDMIEREHILPAIRRLVESK